MSGDTEVIFTPWPYDAVARGMALLDEKVPGWRERIELRDLDMTDCQLCVLGQIFGDYMDGLDEVLPEALIALGRDIEADAGFELLHAGRDATGRYAVLADAWREAIAGGSK